MPLIRSRWIEHVGVIDVGQPDRPALGRDPAGEARPQRDPHALLHLLLEADGRAGDELTPLGSSRRTATVST